MNEHLNKAIDDLRSAIDNLQACQKIAAVKNELAWLAILPSIGQVSEVRRQLLQISVALHDKKN